MREKLTPAVLITPGQIIKRELREKRWTQKGLALVMNRPEQTISEIVNGKKRITPETARELAAAFGTSPEFWINLESNYQLHKAEKEKVEDDIRSRSVLSAYQADELKKRGWIKGIVTLSSLREFLGFDPIIDVIRATAHFRYSVSRMPQSEPLLAWYARAKALAYFSPIAKRISMEEGIKKLLELSFENIAVHEVKRILKDMGIVFLVVPKLPKTSLFGAAFRIGNKQVIVLTLYYKTIDCFWFNLMHELAHLSFNHKEVFFDYIDKDKSKNEDEEAADQLAADWLINSSEFRKFKLTIKNHRIAEQDIEEFARKIKRHPGIIVGRLQHDGLLGWSSRLSSYKTNVFNLFEDFVDKPA